MNIETKAKFHIWIEKADLKSTLRAELEQAGETELEEWFYKDLEFGTGGLRGVMGAGTNRMNIYTVRKATQGIANYINEKKLTKIVAIAYDSRTNSKLFAENAAGVMLANGIRVYLYDELMPAPALSFATRYHKCTIGIMITASHNPKEYNGYKVYNQQGCQVTLEQAADILSYIERVDIFDDVNFTEINTQSKSQIDDATLNYMTCETKEAYLKAVMAQSTGVPKMVLKKLQVAYTPLNGAGNKPVREVLKRMGMESIYVVKEQEKPDGNFPTCPYPNPEKAEALARGIELCLEKNADLLIATDPDSDRVGVAVKNNGSIQILTGNEVGLLLFDFICGRRQENRTMPKNPVAVRTIVTSAMTDEIAQSYGVEVKTTLTGFKFIGELIGEMETENREADYIFGFEESCGYLSGGYVRDKDGVNAALLVCEMAAFYKEQGINLVQRMQQLYSKYGYYKNSLIDFTLKGIDGMKKMSEIMTDFRTNPTREAAGMKIVKTADYMKGEIYIRGDSCRCDLVAGTRPIDLPKSDIMEFGLAGGSGFTVRPSGTEPKLKIYIFAKGENETAATEITERLKKELTARVNSV